MIFRRSTRSRRHPGADALNRNHQIISEKLVVSWHPGSRWPARLYSIFALFALLTAAIAVLSDYNTRRGAELTHAIETANLAALNVERVNSLVYAVVMESRGVYMSTEPAVVKKYGEGLLKFNDQILDVVKRWEAIVQADDAEQFATFKKRIEQFVEFRKELVRRANEISPAAGREWGDNDANRSVRSALNKDLEALSKVYAERGKRIAAADRDQPQLSFVLTCLGGVALLLVVIGVVIIARSIARPLSVITATIKQVADGAENVEVPHTGRADEIGALARAIKIFQEAMERNRNLTSQVSEESAARAGAQPAYRGLRRGVPQAIGAVLHALHRQRLGHAQHRADHQPRHLGCQRARGGGVRRHQRRPPATSRRSRARPKSCRPRCRRSAARCGSPPDAVEQTGQRTEKSISEIESLAAATQRIDGVLTLIQAIAEQTNLLALNATIEAARAGDAGRGFAVVAHEVKALAGQTAKATEEIGQNVGLIQSSTRNAVDAVREIGGAVREINDITSAIAGAVGQQDAATREISANAQSAAQGNETLVANINSLRDAIGETNTAAASVLRPPDDLAATAETLSREVEKFFHNLRSGSAETRKSA